MDRLVLASSSPRRKEILERYNFTPMIVKSSISESINIDEDPVQIAMSLAFEKANNVSQRYKDKIVIGADTIVTLDNKILGKPKDREEAFSILSKLSGNKHHVITGIAVIKEDEDFKLIDCETTTVEFRELSHERINNYIDSKEPFDKAGAYGIQGLGAILVEKIDGCYSNVVGLPLTKIDHILVKCFNINLL